jgi:hypothetical protein
VLNKPSLRPENIATCSMLDFLRAISSTLKMATSESSGEFKKPHGFTGKNGEVLKLIVVYNSLSGRCMS